MLQTRVNKIISNGFIAILVLHVVANSKAMVPVIELKLTKICGGLRGAEGPVFDTDLNFYVVAPKGVVKSSCENDFIDGISGSLHKVNLAAGTEEIACTPLVDGYGGRPNGAQSDKENNIWVADMRLGIWKYSKQNGCQQISKVDSDGNPMQGCNDMMFDKNGNLWITGPATAIAPVPEDNVTMFTDPVGVLYYLEKGKTVPMKVANEKFRFCNGLVIKDDVLLVGDMMTRTILAFDVISPGKLSNRRVWGKVPEEAYAEPLKIGGPDGLVFDIRGRLLVAHSNGGHVEVFTPDGKLEKRLKTPFNGPSNLQFLPNSKTCYLTDQETSAVYEFEWECEGMPMYVNT